MQQLTVQNQQDFSKLQQLVPQKNSFSPNDSYSSYVEDSSSKKSFSDFVSEARTNSENFSNSESEKTADAEKTFSKNDEKVENSEKKSELAKNENSEVPEKTKSVLKDSKKIDEKCSGKTQKKSLVKKTEAERTDSEEKTDLNKKNLEKLDEISVKTSRKSEIKNSKEEKTQKTEQKAKNQPENEDFALENSVIASGSTVEFQAGNLNAQENSDFSDLLADDSEKIGEIDSKSEKTFFLDKDKKISVQDFRSDNIEKNPDEKTEKSVVEISEIHRDEKNNPQVTIDFAAASANQNIISSDNQTAGATGSNFQAMLANQIQENAGEIVKAGNIVLKDNDVGSIKLILHPESLGNVKIDLHLNDKNISGKIIVATQEAFNAFKETAENLKQAFTQNGFDSVGLELSLANQGFGQNNPGENQNNPAVEFAMRKIYGELNIFSEGNSEEIEFLENSSRNSVNIVA